MSELLDRLQEHVNLLEGPEALERFLREALLYPGLGVRALASRLSLPVPLVSAVRGELRRRGLAEPAGGVRLTERGRLFALEELRCRDADLQFWRTLLTTSEPQNLLREELCLLERLYAARPAPDTTVDQSKATAATGLRRALLCLRRGGLVGKRVLCLGDDDLTSLALGLLTRRLFGKACPREAIVVVELDSRVVSCGRRLSEQYQLPVQWVEHDLRTPLPPALGGRFDTLLTDPPYTLSGAELFLRRGLEGLRTPGGSLLLLSMGAKAPPFRLELQRLLCELGLVLERFYPGFNEYEGAQLLGGRSDMTVLRATGKRTAPAEVWRRPIYTGELRRTVRKYRCAACGWRTRVGAEEFYRTIEELKRGRCPRCGGEKFRLENRMGCGKSLSSLKKD